MASNDICSTLDKYIQDHANRSDSLYDYCKLLFADLDDDECATFDFSHRFQKDAVTLTNLLCDGSEINRLKSAEIIIEYARRDALSQPQIVSLITTLHIRICNHNEPSEEVRTALLFILQHILEKFGFFLSPYIENISAIFLQVLKTKAPEALIACCDCIALFFDLNNLDIREKADIIAKPLTNVTFSQRFKVRKASVRALGSLAICCSAEVMKEVALCIAQHSDDIPQVRVSLVYTTAKIALLRPDRYSYWSHILPCLLLCIRDTDQSTRDSAIVQYSAVGEQYVKENREELQEKLVLDLKPSRYPNVDMQRFNLGCRLLAQQVTPCLLRGIKGDLRDWRSESRWASSKLLSSLVLLGELQLHQHALTIIRLLAVASRDTEDRVVAEAFICAEYLGYFLLPGCSLPLCLQVVESSASVLHHRSLRLLQLLTVGLTGPMIAPYLALILDTVLLTSTNLLATDAVVQDDTLALIEALLDKCHVDDVDTITVDDGLRNLLDFSALISSANKNDKLSDNEVLKDCIEGHTEEFNSSQSTEAVSESSNKDSQNDSAAQKSSSSVQDTALSFHLSALNYSDNHSASFKILRLLCIIIGSERCPENTRKAEELLSSLASNTNSASLGSLVVRHANALIDHFIRGAELWTLQDPEFMTACAFLNLSAECLPVSSAAQLLQLYRNVLNSTAVDRLVHIRMLGLICPLIANRTGPVLSSPDKGVMLADMINGWLGGLILQRAYSREVEVVRSGAMELLASACLAYSSAATTCSAEATESLAETEESVSVGDSEQEIQDAALRDALAAIVNVLARLMEDNVLQTRHSALLLLLHVSQQHPVLLLSGPLLYSCINGLVGRLDDIHASVRSLAASIFGKVITNLNSFFSRALRYSSQRTSVCKTPINQCEQQQESGVQSQNIDVEQQPSASLPDTAHDDTSSQSRSSSAASSASTSQASLPLQPDSSPSHCETSTCAEAALAHLERCLDDVLPRVLLFLQDPTPNQRALVHESCIQLLPLYPCLMRQCLLLQSQRSRDRNDGLTADLLRKLNMNEVQDS